VTNPATDKANAQAPPQPVDPLAAALDPGAFTSGDDGAVLWLAPADVHGGCPSCASAPMLTWVYSSGVAAHVDPPGPVRLETYDPQAVPGTCNCNFIVPKLGVAWIDPNTAVAVYPNPANLKHATVSVVTKQPAGKTPYRLEPDIPVDLATERFVLRSSEGLAFLLIADGQGNGIQVFTFDPRCEAPH
jgi:hypothetical protein